MLLQTAVGASVVAKVGAAVAGAKVGAAVTGAKVGAAVTGAKLGASVVGVVLGTAVEGAELGAAVDGSGLGAADELGALVGCCVRQAHTPLSDTGSESQITFGISPFNPKSRSSLHVVSGPPETGTTSAPLLHKRQTGYGPPCTGVIMIINMTRRRLMWFQSRRRTGRFDFIVRMWSFVFLASWCWCMVVSRVVPSIHTVE
jgi:hypothetical protein